MTNISPGELATGQYITILNVKPYKVLAPTMEGPREVEVRNERHALRGVPLKIYGIKFPFISAGNILENTEGFKGVTINLNDYEIMEVGEDYAKGYKEMVERKNSQGENNIHEATAIENDHDHQITDDEEEELEEEVSESKEKPKPEQKSQPQERTITLTESKFIALRAELIAEGMKCALEELKKRAMLEELEKAKEAKQKIKATKPTIKKKAKKNEKPE